MTRVLELPNRSTQPTNSYVLDPQDIFLAMDGLPRQEVAAWHTHPQGLIGPSSKDMEHRPSEVVPMLVVSLTDAGPVAAWF